MNERVPWFERKFNFDFPAGVYLEVLERLRDAPLRARAKVQNLSGDVLTRQASETWSIQENIGHMGDLEPLWSGRLDDILDGREVLREAELTNQKTHEAGHNDARINALVESFVSLRGELSDRLDSLDPSAFSQSSLHPRLKVPMRLVDMCYFVAEHDDYHLVRITQLTRLFEGQAAEA